MQEWANEMWYDQETDTSIKRFCRGNSVYFTIRRYTITNSYVRYDPLMSGASSQDINAKEVRQVRKSICCSNRQ